MVPHRYYLWIKDNKVEDANLVLFSDYDQNDRDKAFADLTTLKLMCNETVTVWLEVEDLSEIVE